MARRKEKVSLGMCIHPHRQQRRVRESSGAITPEGVERNRGSIVLDVKERIGGICRSLRNICGLKRGFCGFAFRKAGFAFCRSDYLWRVGLKPIQPSAAGNGEIFTMILSGQNVRNCGHFHEHWKYFPKPVQLQPIAELPSF